jgi:hypothetical protein
MLVRHGSLMYFSCHDEQPCQGVLPQLLNRLHEVGIITEDLALPDQRKEEDDLEAIYRGLCRLPGVADSKRRRIDFLCIPWHQKGAALIYYTVSSLHIGAPLRMLTQPHRAMTS